MNKLGIMLGAALTLFAGCSSSESTPSADPPGSTGDGKSTYALLSYVTVEESNSSYVSLFDSLDITSIDFSKAREFPGAAGIGASGGKLFISSGEAPTVTRFDVTSDGKWTEEGQVSFANYGLTTAPLYANVFIDFDHAYMNVNQVDRADWSPRETLLRGKESATPPLLATRDEYKIVAAYSRGIVTRDKRVFWPMYWSDDKYVRFSKTSTIAVYDTETNATRALLDTECPSLDFASQDEEGNIYFSNWVFSVVGPLYDRSLPQNCMVRIKRGEETVDPKFSLRFSDVTDGREAAAFRYLKDGKGLLAVFHKEKVDVTKETDPSKAAQGNNWRFWTLDLNTRKGAPIENIDYFAGGYNAYTIDGRTFVLLPSADYANTTTYEILADGSAVKRFESRGWGYELVKVR